MVERYNPFVIEKKWQQAWDESAAFVAKVDVTREKRYVLEMFPYPSGRLHMGHVRNYSLGDVAARFLRAQGYNVMHPMGWDSFGMPAENAAIQRKVHPGGWTRDNIAYMRDEQFKQFGFSYDWSRELATCEPEYYGHQQKLFIDFFKKGLVYRKESLVNWDPVDNTVLANEQVIDGKGWRSGVLVERKLMPQWFLKITNYADELLADLDQLSGWPERVRLMQANWIGKSEGLTFTFDVKDAGGAPVEGGLEVYTTRPDTLMGVTFCSIAPEHPLALKVAETDAGAAAFAEKCQALGTAQEVIEKAEKKGYKTPFMAVHPLTGAEVPVYIANFVLMAYGTGAVMAVPAHDERDYAFAQAYGLPVKWVIQGTDMPADNAYTGDGVLVDSGEFTGLSNTDAKAAVIAKMEALGKGHKTVNYRLRDWGVSRQRYWGCPIPFIHCETCGVVPVPAEQLPLRLPEDVEFTGAGNPLDNHPTWKHTTCPCCGKAAVRETDTMDTFMDSSWYFIRFVNPHASEPVDAAAAAYWLKGGVDQYIGGVEHAVLHLLYARFVTKVLRDCGYVTVDEPFKALLTQGMVVNASYQAADGTYISPSQVDVREDGAFHKETGEALKVDRLEKMSKSKNNGVDPVELMERYGADTLRAFILFAGPCERDVEWSDAGVEGAWRFLGRLWNLVAVPEFEGWPLAKLPADLLPLSALSAKAERDVKRAVHKTIRKVTADLEKFQFNTAIAAVMELSNLLGSVQAAAKAAFADGGAMARLYKEGVEACVRLMNPMVPHITEELWMRLGHETMLTQTPWVAFDAEAAQDDEIPLVIQVNGKKRLELLVPADISNADAEQQALEAVSGSLAGAEVVRCVVVPKRLVNIVIKG